LEHIPILVSIRTGKDDPNRFWNAKPEKGKIVVLWSLFYDFHSLMNNEIIYIYTPELGTYNKFDNWTPEELEKIDNLARLMQEPDENFDKLKEIYETDKQIRLMTGGLI
jgi:hypothetical protein